MNAMFFLRIHIVTYISIIEIVRVLLDLTRENLCIGNFQSMLQTPMIFGF
jgi:hypothetical protein